MPEIIEATVYRLDELDDAPKDRARAWYRQADFDHDWFAFVYVFLSGIPISLSRQLRPCWFAP